jgi:hypothetical protein
MKFDPSNFDWTKMFGFITQIIEMFCPDPESAAQRMRNRPLIRRLFEGIALRKMGYTGAEMRKARAFCDPILAAEIEVATHEEKVERPKPKNAMRESLRRKKSSKRAVKKVAKKKKLKRL